MSVFYRWRILLLMPALAFALSMVGCGSESKPSAKGGGTGSGGSSVSKGTGTGDKGGGGEATALEGKGTATLKGIVSVDGTPPTPADQKAKMQEIQDANSRNHCLKGDTRDQTWMVGADKGVANVVVWLKAPEGKYFKIPAEQATRSDTVTVEQPFCQFIPHVSAINPSVYDPAAKEQKKTGQKFKVINNAPISHNTAYKGNPLLNPGSNQNLSANGEMPVEAKPCKSSDFGKEDLLNINCDIHKWMTAKVAVFDHPYFAVTDKNGNFEIKNAPAGVELTLVYWHESMGETSLRSAKKETITLQVGDNSKNLTVTAK